MRHDVIAFLTNVAEHVGPDARFVHYGMTSSDVIDTALALQIRDAGALLLAGVDRAGRGALLRRARGAPAHPDGRAAPTASTPSRPPSG